jgi:hypothetical protein
MTKSPENHIITIRGFGDFFKTVNFERAPKSKQYIQEGILHGRV